MDIVAGLVLGGAGLLVGGGTGALVAWLLHLRGVRLRAIQGADVRSEDEFSAGCSALLLGALLGSVLGCGAVFSLAAIIIHS
jgi:hypothetical protein